MSGIELKNGRIAYYGNPAGYLKDNRAIIDKIFQGPTFEAWLAEKKLIPEWTEGVFERLSQGNGMGEASESVPLKNVRIWQLKPDSDFALRFRAYDEILEVCGAPSLENYAAVYEGALGTNDLEAIYTQFNLNHPPGFKGHSLSISDVVELYDEESSDYYYVDRMGFKKIELDDAEHEHAMSLKP